MHPHLGEVCPQGLIALGSIIHHAYARGDYSDFDVEVADLGRPHKEAQRCPHIRLIGRDAILALPLLTVEIEDVYSILRELVPPPKRT